MCKNTAVLYSELAAFLPCGQERQIPWTPHIKELKLVVIIQSNPSRSELYDVYLSEHLPSIESHHNHRVECISNIPLHLTQLRTWRVVSYDLPPTNHQPCLLLLQSLKTRLTKSTAITPTPNTAEAIARFPLLVLENEMLISAGIRSAPTVHARIVTAQTCAGGCGQLLGTNSHSVQARYNRMDRRPWSRLGQLSRAALVPTAYLGPAQMASRLAPAGQPRFCSSRRP